MRYGGCSCFPHENVWCPGGFFAVHLGLSSYTVHALKASSSVLETGITIHPVQFAYGQNCLPFHPLFNSHTVKIECHFITWTILCLGHHLSCMAFHVDGHNYWWFATRRKVANTFLFSPYWHNSDIDHSLASVLPSALKMAHIWQTARFFWPPLEVYVCLLELDKCKRAEAVESLAEKHGFI